MRKQYRRHIAWHMWMKPLFSLFSPPLWTAFHIDMLFGYKNDERSRSFSCKAASENALETAWFQTEMHPCGLRYPCDFCGAKIPGTMPNKPDVELKRIKVVLGVFLTQIRPRLWPYQVSDLTSHDISRQRFCWLIWLLYIFLVIKGSRPTSWTSKSNSRTEIKAASCHVRLGHAVSGSWEAVTGKTVQTSYLISYQLWFRACS